MTNTADPAVTVYVTNHNYGRFLEQAVESVLRQSLQDFELLIIDDGSTDDSHEVIARYSSHPKISTVLQQNKGLNVTNNIALRAARGRYIMRLDADDYLDEHALEILARVLDRDPEAGLVFPDFVTVDPEGRPLEVVRRHDFDAVELFDQPAHGACTLVRRDFLLRLGGYDESFRCQDGWDLWVRVLQEHKVRNVNLPLFYYRQHGENLTRNEERLLSTRGKILEKQARRGGTAEQAVAIIPVRGPSMDTRSKALVELGGRPLMDWTIQAAVDAARVDEVLVTTPDDAVLAHVRAAFPEVRAIRRHRSLARLNTHLEDTINDGLAFLDAEGVPSDRLVVLTIESPFRGGSHIDAALDALDIFGSDTVIGVRPETDAMFQHNGHGLLPVRRGTVLRLEAEEIFRRVGHFVTLRREHLVKTRTLLGGKMGHVVLDQRAAFALGSELDWQVASFLAGLAGATNPTLEPALATVPLGQSPR